jgi:hypothetical protein
VPSRYCEMSSSGMSGVIMTAVNIGRSDVRNFPAL